ncbi:MAG: AAC(3) family N-acetyltransferase [Polyangiales bacterium]
MFLRSEVERAFAAGFDGVDVAIVHAAPRAIGEVVGGIDALTFALLAAASTRTTLVFPAFCAIQSDPAGWTSPPIPRDQIDAARDELLPFDVRDTSPWKMGRHVERIVRDPRAHRSRHPTESVVAIGPRAEEIVRVHPIDDPMGPRSPWARLLELDARVLLVGVGFTRCSMLHHVERMANVAYLDTAAYRTFVDVDGERRWIDVDSGGGCSEGFDAIEPVLRREKLIRDARIGDAKTTIVGARDLFAHATASLTPDPSALLCSELTCDACTRARAAIEIARGGRGG